MDFSDPTTVEDASYVGSALGLLFMSAISVGIMRVRAHGRRRHSFWLLSRNRNLLVTSLLTAALGTCVLLLRSIHYVSMHASAPSVILFALVVVLILVLLILSVSGWRSRNPAVRSGIG